MGRIPVGRVRARLTGVIAVATVASVILAGCTTRGADPSPTQVPSIIPSTASGRPATGPVTVTAPRPNASDSATTTSATTMSVTPTSATPTTAVAAAWPDVTRAAAPAVVRLDVLACDQRWMGSGFVVGDHLVMTANHVAAGASAITVQSSRGVTSADVVGLDPTTDSALLRTKDAVAAHPLAFERADAQLAEPLAVLGFPLEAYELRFTEGSLSGLHEPAEINGEPIDVMITDSAINPGNSGGPVLDQQGKVIGLVSARRLWVSGAPDSQPASGQGYIIRASDLARNVSRWRAADPQPSEDCGDPYDSQGAARTIDVRVDSTASDAPDIARSLLVHGDAINSGTYDAAWQVFTPHMQHVLKDVDSWSSGLDTSYWTRISVENVSGQGDRRVARTVVTTEQDAQFGRDGQTCSVWVFDYSVVRSEGGWLIDAAKLPSGPPTAC